MAARDAMLKRGQSALGDKTVIDTVPTAVAGQGDQLKLAQMARDAAQDVLFRFRDKPNKVGRARMFGEQSRGSDDPGMLAFCQLIEILT